MKLKLSFSILAGVLLLASGCSDEAEKQSIPKTRLVGEFLFDGNATDTNPTGVLHNGSVNGATLTIDRHGRANRAFSFDGVDDYISIPDNDSLDFSAADDFTVSVWASVDLTQAATSGTIGDIVRKWTGNSEGYPYSISFLNDKASVPNSFIFARYDGTTCANSAVGYSPAIDDDNTWHHLVQIRRGAVIYNYVDGVQVSEVDDETSCATTNNSQITIGCRGQLATFFAGKIDDVRFYSRALTDKEINILYQE